MYLISLIHLTYSITKQNHTFWQTAKRQLKLFTQTYTAYVKLNVKKIFMRSFECIARQQLPNISKYYVLFDSITELITCVIKKKKN